MQVELQKEKGTHCLFPVITMMLLMAVLEAIACPYALLWDSFMFGNAIFNLFMGYFIIVSFCHLGQTFINQVGCV